MNINDFDLKKLAELLVKQENDKLMRDWKKCGLGRLFKNNKLTPLEEAYFKHGIGEGILAYQKILLKEYKKND